MNARCRPGDLARITQDVPGCEGNTGRIVEISGPPEVNRQGQLTWLIRPLGAEPYLINNPDGSIEVMKPGETGLEHPDDWMDPVRRATDDTVSRRHETPVLMLAGNRGMQ